ncbi:hypothetical protein HUT18_24390 [Streptomyces sp. NA04227]|nr:hypothetical protein HUT18_24390 [Streptomyces sp. NA04227]
MTFALTGCSDEGGNEADCKAEITKQLKSGKTSEDKPEVCEGISDKDLERLAKEAISEQMKDAKPKAP